MCFYRWFLVFRRSFAGQVNDKRDEHALSPSQCASFLFGLMLNIFVEPKRDLRRRVGGSSVTKLLALFLEGLDLIQAHSRVAHREAAVE